MHEETIDLSALRRLLNVISGDPDDFAELLEEHSRQSAQQPKTQ